MLQTGPTQAMLPGDSRAVVGVFAAVMLPVMLGIAALVVDAGVWSVSKTRLQYAADAAAVATGYLLTNAAMKALPVSASLPTFQAVALAQVKDATQERLAGTLVTPVDVVIASDYSSVKVTLTSTAATFFAGSVGFTAPTLTATATVSLGSTPVCVLALSAAGLKATMADGMGTIKAVGCGIFSNSSAADSIYLDSGTISGVTVGAHGGVLKSSSGSNTFSPPIPTSNAASVPDPFAARVAPTPGACDYTLKSYTTSSVLPHMPPPGVYCGNTVFGGGGSSFIFAPGIYYIKNGNLKFDNATIVTADEVTFVITGTSPGQILWTNYSNTSNPITARTTGPTAGIAFWQTCPQNPGAPIISTFVGGSTLEVSGAIYAPCGDLQLSNAAKIVAPATGAMSVVANRIYTTGSARITARGTDTANTPALTQ